MVVVKQPRPRIMRSLYNLCRMVIGALLAGCLGLTLTAPARAQAITLTVQAGFDGQFRENQWMPLYVQAANDGQAVTGRLVVRPETSGAGLANAYSLPINLPEGARRAAFLYVTARSFASQIRVEFIDDEGVVLAAAAADVRALQPADRLAVVVTGSAAGAVDLTGAHAANVRAFQANWTTDRLPDRAAALEAVNLLLFSDVDTGSLSAAQRQAVADWTAAGGHLIVTGGANWQATASGLADWLPLVPEGSVTVDDLAALSAWTRVDGDLAGTTLIAAGTLRPDARTLVEDAGGAPLVVRRALGAGTVDYLTFDPAARPVRGWGGLTAFWTALMSSVSPQPGWYHGFQNWEQATSAINIFPGINLLPDILPLCGFLALYIALIGPVNYLVLSRLNRRELAWLTIPFFIILFSALAWVVGSNLRGNAVTISRLAVVQSWPQAERAYAQQLVGLLSPRRDQYSLAMVTDAFLRPIPRLGGGSLLAGGGRTAADIVQAATFSAREFPVDASFVAGFNAAAFIEKPAVSGQARLVYAGVDGQQVLRGSVRNDSDLTLAAPVILARGTSFRLASDLAPGDVATFDLTLPGEGLPPPAPAAYAPGMLVRSALRGFGFQNALPATLRDILDTTLPERGLARFTGGTPAEQETYRRRLFLSSFISDPFNQTTSRGDRAFLAAWNAGAPLDFELDDASWSTLDTTLMLVELAVDMPPPAGDVLVTGDRFTWTVETLTGLSDYAPFGLTLQPGDEVAFRFTPFPAAVLRQVTELVVRVDRGATTSRSIPLQLWDWGRQRWDEVSVPSGGRYSLRSPQRYLGPQNSVQVRVMAEAFSAFPRIQDLTIEQRGRF